MNQQLIDKFLHKSGARFGAEGTDYSSFTSSKFAELIVRECAWAADFADKEPGDYVLKHFGVEE